MIRLVSIRLALLLSCVCIFIHQSRLAFGVDSKHSWLDSVYQESLDMADASFLIYTFSYIVEFARNHGDIESVRFDENDDYVQNVLTTADFDRMLSRNLESLRKEFPSQFKNDLELQKSLERLKKRSVDNSLTLQYFNDNDQDKELVYAIAKDDKNERITLVFRGTENELAFFSDWRTNTSIRKIKAPLPKAINQEVSGITNVYFHGGFYNYLFSETYTQDDLEGSRKFDEILANVKKLTKEYPHYKLYVTGHSLGGALASIASFYMSTDPDFSEPVTCITSGAPRVGDYNYLKVSQILEKKGKLRFCRIVNDKDLVTLVPVWRYHHAGIQIRLHSSEGEKPEITYLTENASRAERMRLLWINSMFTGLNLKYDHGDYRERIKLHQKSLEFSLNKLYQKWNMN